MKLATRTLLAFTLAGGALAATQGPDFDKVYAGKLDFKEGALGQRWTSHVEDVWRLSDFQYRFKDELELDLGPSVVVFGKHQSDRRGKSVVWASVFPRDMEAGEPIVAAHPGHKNTVASVFLRFNPSIVGDLFPKKTVVGRGNPLWLLEGKRLYQHKINAVWQSENMPVVPWKQSIIIDLETVEGKRRFYNVDTKKKEVKYVEAFEGRTVPSPPSEPVEPEASVAAFDKVWEAFDREYAMFAIKPDVDWPALREIYRPLAAQASTEFETAGVIASMLSHLEDLHVHVKQSNMWLPGFVRMRMLNANWPWLKEGLSEFDEVSSKVSWGKADDDIGYIAVWNLSQDGLVDAFDQALDALGSTKALIIDLRFNGGGNENLGKSMAGRFLEEEKTYSFSQYRSGAAHTDLGEKYARTVEPRGPWTYSAPIAILIGRKTFSSAESFALMLAQAPDAVTFGDATGGSSGNPRQLDAGLGITVNLPRWIDFDDKGEPIDEVGVAPMKPVDTPTHASFRKTDPVFEAALKHCKKRKAKKPGKQE